MEHRLEPASTRKGPLRQGGNLAVLSAHGIALEMPPYIPVQIGVHQGIFPAGGNLENLDLFSGGPGGGSQDSVDDKVHGNQVNGHIAPGRKIGYQAAAVGHDQRIRHLEPADPTGLGIIQTALDDTGTHDDERHLAAMLHQHLLAHGFGEGVDIVPAIGPGPAHAFLDQLALDPALATVVHELGQAPLG